MVLQLPQNKQLPFLIDTRANVSILTTEDYKKLGAPALNHNTCTSYAANNTELKVLGFVTLQRTIGQITAPQSFFVCKDIDESILSIDGVHDFDIVINSRGYTTRGKVKAILHDDGCAIPLMRATQHATIPPGKVAQISIVATNRNPKDNPSNSNIIIDPATSAGLPRVITIYSGLYHVDKSFRTELVVANTSQNNIEIKKGMFLAVYDGICQELLAHLPEHADKDSLMDIDPSLASNQISVERTQTMSSEEIVASMKSMKLPTDHMDYEAIRQHILENLSVFSPSESDIGNFYQLKADLLVDETAPPAFSKQFPASEEQTKPLVS